MGNTTTIDAAHVAYYHPPIDAATFSGTTNPTSTAVGDMITRAQNYVNELAPDCSQNSHDEAVHEIVSEFVKRYTQNLLGAGGDSTSGDKSGSFSWSPNKLLSAETKKELVMKSQHKAKPRMTLGRSFTY